MQKRQPVSAVSREAVSSLSLAHWERHVQGWLLDGDLRLLSKRTLEERRLITGKLSWFLRDREFSEVGAHELRAFLAYVSRGHENAGGRWGNGRMTRPVKPRTARAYHRVLTALCTWLVEREGVLDASPMAKLTAPLVRADQIQPFTDDEVDAILAAAKRSNQPRRNEALVWFLLDTGARITEVCGAKVGDLDLPGRKVRIRGKGGKERTLFLGRNATKAIWAFLRDDPRPDCEPLFPSESGKTCGEAMTRNGLHKLVVRLGEEAKVTGTRCSAHTFRHYFAVSFLRAGGNTFTLKEMLGHTTLEMTNKYVALAAADLESQHRQFSPGDRLRRR